MELENKNNNILDDLELRNRNWSNIQYRLDILDGYILKDIESFTDVQRIVRMGIADKVFTVGDQLTATYEGRPYRWDVIGINHDKPSDPKYKHSLTIQAHECLLNAVFSAAQAMAHTSVALAPGDQYFTFDSKQYKFTNTVALDEGSVVVGVGWTDYVPATLTTYKADRVTVIESGIAVTQVSGQTDTITDVNDRIRSRYGSNNYIESGIRQWLNSNETAFKWKSKTKFDMPSSYKTGGFLKLLDQDLVNVIGKVDKQVARNTVTDGGGQDLFSDKVFLLSRKEVYAGDEGTVTGENPYEYYSVMASAPHGGDVDWRIKYLNESPLIWWLRSPHVGFSDIPRFVNTTGYVGNYHATSAFGIAPACTII